jgi:hypothetical protein
MPASRFVVLEHAGHFPPLEDPGGVMDALRDFIREQPPSQPDPDRFRRLLRRGAS